MLELVDERWSEVRGELDAAREPWRAWLQDGKPNIWRERW